MSAEIDIYDFETVLAGAVQDVLDAVDLATLSVLDPQTFQKARARCEVFFMFGGSESPARLHPEVGFDATPGALREMAFKGQFKIDVITNIEPVGEGDVIPEQVHSAYRARIRNVCSVIKRTINDGVILPHHKVQSFASIGADYDWDATKGYFKTSLMFDVKFSIQNNAFASL